MKSWWLSISPRERRMVLLAGGSLLLAILYWGMWRPFQQSVTYAERQLKMQQETLSWMQLRAPDAMALRGGGRSVDLGMTLEGVANQSARQLGLSLSRLQPIDKQLQVELAPRELERLMNWLVIMERDYGVTPQLIELAREGGKGMVRVRRLQLGRG